MKPWIYCMLWTSGKCCDIDAHWIGNVNSRRLYLCVLRCVADRVIWDFLLSLTVMTINHNHLCFVCPHWYNHVPHTVVDAAPTFSICLVFFPLFFTQCSLKIHQFIFLGGHVTWKHEVANIVCIALSEKNWGFLLLSQCCPRMN